MSGEKPVVVVDGLGFIAIWTFLTACAAIRGCEYLSVIAENSKPEGTVQVIEMEAE